MPASIVSPGCLASPFAHGLIRNCWHTQAGAAQTLMHRASCVAALIGRHAAGLPCLTSCTWQAVQRCSTQVQLPALKAVLRQLYKKVHPDLFSDDQTARLANEHSFKLLQARGTDRHGLRMRSLPSDLLQHTLAAGPRLERCARASRNTWMQRSRAARLAAQPACRTTLSSMSRMRRRGPVRTNSPVPVRARLCPAVPRVLLTPDEARLQRRPTCGASR